MKLDADQLEALNLVWDLGHFDVLVAHVEWLLTTNGKEKYTRTSSSEKHVKNSPREIGTSQTKNHPQDDYMGLDPESDYYRDLPQADD